MATRRQFLLSLASAGSGALLPGCLRGQSDDATPNALAGVRLEPFVDPLFLTPVLRPTSEISGSEHYRITLSEFQQKLHRDLPPAVVWGFEGITPGPVIAAQRGRAVTIDWLNRLPARHRLTIDHSLDGAGKDLPEVRTTIHLHGGHVSASNDGYPEDWITPGKQQRTVYPNRQPGATLWYHDHAMGITRLNAMMGLAGVYLIRDPAEERLGLPAGRFDIPLVLQDRILDARGQLVYPVSDSIDAPSVAEFFGTNILVNGRVSPYLDVEPRLYRFRLLNAANSRMFQLSLVPGQRFIQIGSDGGLLPEPVIRSEIFIAPAERLEVILDFRGREGRRMMLVNNAPTPYPSGGGPVPGLVMQFRVGRPLSADIDTGRIPDTLRAVPRLQETAAVKTRSLKLVEIMAMKGQPHRVLLDGRRFMDPVTEDPLNGSVEIWEFVNTTLDAHPIHLHAVHFQLLDRRPFDVRRLERTSEVVLTGKVLQPAPEERGWKDTILCPPGQVTRIITPFAGEPGRFVWHCHMLEHEDNEMMRPFLLRA
jgi:spore coat protein A